MHVYNVQSGVLKYLCLMGITIAGSLYANYWLAITKHNLFHLMNLMLFYQLEANN